jgi:hypothetical protein
VHDVNICDGAEELELLLQHLRGDRVGQAADEEGVVRVVCSLPVMRLTSMRIPLLSLKSD